MLDCDIFEALAKQLGIADHTRRGSVDGADEYGEVHLILFGDFKQLPPATSELGRRIGIDASMPPTGPSASPSGVHASEGLRGKPPFISIPRVYQKFDFRVLRQNRRVVSDERRRDELENFHQARGARIARSALPRDVSAIARCCSTCLTGSRPSGCATSSWKRMCAEQNAAARTAAASRIPRRCLRNGGAAKSQTVGGAPWEDITHGPSTPMSRRAPAPANASIRVGV